MWISALFASASVPAFAAEPLFLPDFTPATDAEFAVSVMIQELVVDRLLKNDYIVLNSAVVGRVLGVDRVTNCASRPECPLDILPKVPTQVAVVVGVARVPSGLVGTVKLYQAGLAEPVDELFLPIEPGREAAFATAIVNNADMLVAELGSSPDPVVAAAARMLAGQTQPDFVAPTPVATPPLPPPAADPPKRHRDPPPGPRRVPQEAAEVGTEEVPSRYAAGVEDRFLASGLSADEWLRRATPHAGRVVFEVRAGIGGGDVDRAADVRVQAVEGTATGSWYSEGPAAGRRPRADVFVGYAPLAAIDVGVLAGVQYGHRVANTRVITVSSQGDLVSNEASGPLEVKAVQVYVQPRIRLFPVPLGPVKPYLLTGMDFRIFDDYEIVQRGSVRYPQPLGGLIPGWHGGAGLMFDPVPTVGAFVEGGYTRHFGAFSAAQEITVGDWSQNTPAPQVTQRITLSLVGGLQFRI